MRILHINTGQTGGAAICAMRISKALEEQGVESRMLVQAGYAHDNVYVAEKDQSLWNKNWFTLKLKHLMTRLGVLVDEDVLWHKRHLAMPNCNNVVYTNVPLTSYTNIAHHPLIEWADVIHLHWVACMVDYPSFFKKVKKPIVWTLHDQYPALGLMHFQSENFPLPKQLIELDHECVKIKRKAIEQCHNLDIVTISAFMEEVCHNSEILYDAPTHLIHNGVDTNVFHPCNKERIRQKMGIPANSSVFLFSSYGLWVERKGLKNVLKALEQLNLSNAVLICVGDDEGTPVTSSSINVITAGLIDNIEKMSEMYSVADYYLQASCHEAFSQTSLEAMSCGTPVVSTPCSGASDLIREFNGIICSGFSAEDLLAGIKEAMLRAYDINIIRDHIIKEYDYPVIAKQYIQLYKEVQHKK